MTMIEADVSSATVFKDRLTIQQGRLLPANGGGVGSSCRPCWLRRSSRRDAILSPQNIVIDDAEPRFLR